VQLGHIACQIASRGMGMRVIGIDSASKRDLVLDSGAELFIDHLQGQEDEKVKAATDGLGAQAVLVLTAANLAYASGMSMLRFGGSLVCVGVPDGALEPIATAFPQHMVG
jgi:propanol-preferring alcohol dehydrogenase